jgi:hypothetical protein
MFCRSVRIKSHRNDAPLYRGRSYDQERAPERIVPMYSPLALINADDTRLAFLAFTLIFRDLLNETQTQSQFATDTRNIGIFSTLRPFVGDLTKRKRARI